MLVRHGQFTTLNFVFETQFVSRNKYTNTRAVVCVRVESFFKMFDIVILKKISSTPKQFDLLYIYFYLTPLCLV